jgi:hypothetical protein
VKRTDSSGIGSFGEIAQGPDGNLYQWVQGVDALGNPIGCWRRRRRIARGVARVARRTVPAVQRLAPVIPQAAVAGSAGLGALCQAPDGTVYEVQAGEEEPQNFGQDELTQVMGMGYPGECARARRQPLPVGPGWMGWATHWLLERLKKIAEASQTCR